MKKALADERIGTRSLLKDEGRIVTENLRVDGKPIPLFKYSRSVYYQYVLDLEKVGDRKVNLKITCNEAKDVLGGVPFQRLKNPETIRRKLEYWLYERIEKSLQAK